MIILMSGMYSLCKSRRNQTNIICFKKNKNRNIPPKLTEPPKFLMRGLSIPTVRTSSFPTLENSQPLNDKEEDE
jgi:hypothetical protein